MYICMYVCMYVCLYVMQLNAKVDSFGLTEISKEELMQLSHTIHASHAKGVDDIDPTRALPSLPNIIQPLVEIINCSFKTGIYPLSP